MPQRTIGRPVDEEWSPERDPAEGAANQAHLTNLPPSPPSQTRPSRPPTKITIYRTEVGLWRFTDAPGRVAVEAILVAGARVGEDRNGVPCIFDPSNALMMTADQAVQVGVLQIPIFRN